MTRADIYRMVRLPHRFLHTSILMLTSWTAANIVLKRHRKGLSCLDLLLALTSTMMLILFDIDVVQIFITLLFHLVEKTLVLTSDHIRRSQSQLL